MDDAGEVPMIPRRDARSVWGVMRAPVPGLDLRQRRGAVTSPRRNGGEAPLRIAMLAPPWIPVPAPGYGGIEVVVDVLTDALVALGHAVTLFAAPGSRSRATVRPMLSVAHPEAIGQSRYEADHVARAFDEVDLAAARGLPFDVVHDHCAVTALAMANRLPTPMVHTVHVPFDADARSIYQRHGHKADVVAISRAQLATAPAALRDARVIPNPLDLRRSMFSAHKGDHLVWLGRMTEYKGPHRAIDVAHAAGRRIVIAGPIQAGQEAFFAEEVAPRLESPHAHYIGEVGGAPKQRLLAGAAALLMPIRWHEPFGMVMIEALAAGTPVIAFPEGAATEVVLDGLNGFLVKDEDAMAAAVRRLDSIDPARCRASVASRYDAPEVARSYVAAYRDGARRSQSFARPTGELQPAATR